MALQSLIPYHHDQRGLFRYHLGLNEVGVIENGERKNDRSMVVLQRYPFTNYDSG